MLTLLENVDLYAPESRGVCHVLVAGGKVVHIGQGELTLDDTLDVERIDLAGSRLIPGLVDGHVHITGGGGEAGPATSVPALSLSDYTLAGVTTVIGLLGTDDQVRTTASLLAKVHALRAEGLSAWCLTGGYSVPPQTLTGSVRGDIVNLDPVIGVGEVAISDHRSSQPTVSELLRLSSDARVAGLLADKAGIVHLHVGDGDRGLSLLRQMLEVSELPAATFHPTHVNRRKALFAEAMELTRWGVTIDVTAFPVSDSPSEDDDEWSAAAALAMFLDADTDPALITVSSDAGGSVASYGPDGRMAELAVGTPVWLSRTIAELVGSGRDLAAVLPAFTSNPARVFRLTGKGRIAVGADADLVVLDDEHHPKHVMAGGRWHVRDGAPVTRGTFET